MLKPSSAGPGQEIRFAFTATGWDYFWIFLTNLLLTIATCGIYSAWARARTRRFFLENTFLGPHSFDFNAPPASILFARVLVGGALLAFGFAGAAFDPVWAGAAIGATLLLPLALARGRAFVARHSMHRGVRFHYRAAYLPTFLLAAGWTAAAGAAGLALDGINDEDFRYAPLLLPALAAAPALVWLGHRVQLGQLSFGALPLRHEGGVFGYYGELLKAGGYVAFIVAVFALGAQAEALGLAVEIVASLAALGLVLHGAGVLRALFTRDVTVPQAVAFVVVVFLIIPLADEALEHWYGEDSIGLSGAIFILAAGAHFLALVRAAASCAYWRSVRLGADGELRSDLDWFRYAQLLTGGYIMTVLSLGLLHPWARVRASAHVAERLRLVLGRETARAYAAAGAEPGPLDGGSAGGGWDLDFGAV